jgi:hypothetical protein
MNVVKNFLLASSIITWPTVVWAQHLEVQTELQKNKNLVFETLNMPSHHIWKKANITVSEKSKEYFQEYVLPKIKLPITENISWGVFKSHTWWGLVGIRYQFNTSKLQREHISVWIWKDNKAEIMYNLKF